MGRVLFVEESEVLRQILIDACFPQDVVHICTDGHTALRELTDFRPEMLVLNLSLPYKDGLSVLREAAYLPRQVIVFSYLTGPRILNTLSYLGAQQVLHMPTPSGMRQALETVRNQSNGVRADLRQLVTEHLHRLGVPTNLDGYKMLTVGLPLYCRDTTQPLSKELYPAIACALGQGTTQTVERSIRHAVTVAWENRNDDIWRQYFALNAAGEISCPANKQLLTVLSHLLLQELALQEEEKL